MSRHQARSSSSSDQASSTSKLRRTEAEPTDLTTAWAAGWIRAGYTDAGHTFTYTPSYENIEVAETLLPISKVAAGQETDPRVRVCRDQRA